MTKQYIEIAFGNALTQAKQLDKCADDLMNAAKNNLSNIESDIQGAWRGKSAEMYLDKVDEVSRNMIKTANKLYKAAETLRKVANVFRNTELKALELAQQRTM